MGGGVRDRPPISGKPPIGLSFIIYKASAGYRIKFLQAAASALSVWQDTMGQLGPEDCQLLLQIRVLNI